MKYRGTTLLRAVLARGAFERSNKRILCNGSTRRALSSSVRTRSSETMFPPCFRAPFQLPGLSAAVLRGYSSLHRL